MGTNGRRNTPELDLKSLNQSTQRVILKMKKIFFSIIIAFLLFFGAISAILPLTKAQTTMTDWAKPFSDTSGTNFSSQTVINRANVNQLVIKWIYPLNEPALPGVIKIYGAVYPPFSGISTAPIVLNGILYFQTADQNVYAQS